MTAASTFSLGKKGVEIALGWFDSYNEALTNLASWTNNNSALCKQLVGSGLLLHNINFMKTRFPSELEVTFLFLVSEFCSEFLLQRLNLGYHAVT